MVTIARNAFLPVRKHKLIVSQNEGETMATTNDDNSPGFYMPYDPPCLLANVYGMDFMTPKKGASSQATWGTENGRPAHDNPKCNYTLTASEKEELARQLELC